MSIASDVVEKLLATKSAKQQSRQDSYRVAVAADADGTLTEAELDPHLQLSSALMLECPQSHRHKNVGIETEDGDGCHCRCQDCGSVWTVERPLEPSYKPDAKKFKADVLLLKERRVWVEQRKGKAAAVKQKRKLQSQIEAAEYKVQSAADARDALIEKLKPQVAEADAKLRAASSAESELYRTCNNQSLLSRINTLSVQLRKIGDEHQTLKQDLWGSRGVPDEIENCDVFQHSTGSQQLTLERKISNLRAGEQSLKHMKELTAARTELEHFERTILEPRMARAATLNNRILSLRRELDELTKRKLEP